jgi:hypothetical protein
VPTGPNGRSESHVTHCHQRATRRDALAHRSALKYKARLFADFGHFMSRYYAKQSGIDGQAIRIIPLDRQSNYACELVDRAARDDWQKFVRMGEQFGIDEAALLALCGDALMRKATQLMGLQRRSPSLRKPKWPAGHLGL